jgi:TRAP-type C4-dicarboxylate transport system substrate-binding protein
VKKKVFFIFLALTLLALPFLTACEAGEENGAVNGNGNGEEEPPEVIELKCATYFPPPSRQAQTLEAFCLEVEARTGGKIKIEYFPGGTLLDASAMYQGIVDRVADIGFAPIHYTAGRFSVTEVITSTLGWPSAWVGAHVAMEFYSEFQPAEWDDVKMLWLQANEPKVIYTKEPVHTLEDLAGLTIRAPGSAGNIISALGATPAPTPTSEMADAIAKGTIDGAFLPLETLKTFSTAEVVNYITACWNIGSTDCFYTVMNKDAYASLEALPEAKAIFDEVCGKYAEIFALMWNSIDFDGLAYAEGFGVEVIELSAVEAARWEEAAAPAVETYIQNMVDAGYTEAEVRGWIDFLQERIDYWTALQATYKILSLTGPPEIMSQ